MAELLLLNDAAMFWRKIDTLGAAAVVDHLEVGTQRNSDGIHYLHVEGLFQEDSLGVDGLMRDLVLL